ncbi:hypothetical protein FRC09_000098 [Ceratobasidium sp. 395]|nr:hypothetical protein FRC09_000098 [Ceratobasidium sp. 395]
MANLSSTSSTSQTGPKLAHALPTGSAAANVKIGHVQLRDLVHSTGPRGRVAYVSDKCIKEVDVRRGTQTTRTLAALDFQPNCIALSPSGLLLIAGGQRAELQVTTVAPPPRPSSSGRKQSRSRYGTAVSDERGKPVKGGYSVVDESDEETDEEEVDDCMEWSRPGEGQATRTRRNEVRGGGHRDLASINNHVLVLGDEPTTGGVYGETQRNPEQTRIVVSNNDEYVRVYDVDTRESAGREWGGLDLVGAVKLGTAANHVSFSPDGRTMLAVGDDTRLQIFNANSRSRLVDFEHVGSYTSGTEPNFTSAWSASGLQFAAASQDGTVTAWDVRSSRPLASWHVPFRSGYKPHARPLSPPSAPVPTRASMRMGSGAWRTYQTYQYDSRYAGAYMNTEQFMWDPSTQGPGHGIRSLRFSPRGASAPEMLVFAEHTSKVHIIDAQTFTSHQIIEVPRAPRLGPESPVREPVTLPPGGVDQCAGGPVGGAGFYMPGQGVDPRGEREVDLTGVTFDRTGGWMYVGTERSVVEYEMVGRGRRTYDVAEWN